MKIFFIEIKNYEKTIQELQNFSQKILDIETHFYIISKVINIKKFKNNINIVTHKFNLQKILNKHKIKNIENDLCLILTTDLFLSSFPRNKNTYALDDMNKKTKTLFKRFTSSLKQNGVVEAINDFLYRTEKKWF